MRRLAAAAALLLALAAWAPPAAAQAVPLPLPPPPAPPLPTGNVQRSLGGAFGAISAATATNPGAAQQANFLYQSALQRYRAGDFAAAAAEANAARALAAGPVSVPLQPLSALGRPPARLGTPGGPPATRSGSAAPGVVMPVVPDDLLRARTEIELAAELDGPQLEQAKRHYRAALDAYLSGDRAKEVREANASFALAEQVLERPPKPVP